MKRGEIWWADLGPYRTREQTGRRPVIVWQSDTLTRLLQSVLVVPLTTNLDRAKLAGTALISASDGALAADSVALAFQMRAIPKASLKDADSFAVRRRTLGVGLGDRRGCWPSRTGDRAGIGAGSPTPEWSRRRGTAACAPRLIRKR